MKFNLFTACVKKVAGDDSYKKVHKKTIWKKPMDLRWLEHFRPHYKDRVFTEMV